MIAATNKNEMAMFGDWLDGFKSRYYTIKKGRHYSNFIPRIFKARDGQYMTTEYHVRFNFSMMYRTEEKSCVNKLFGYSFGVFGVHKDSARFGWSCEDNMILLYVYYYKDGKLNKKLVARYFDDDVAELRICNVYDKVGKIQCVEWYVGNTMVHRAYFKSHNGWMLSLGFYFGGKMTAPHDMHLEYDERITKNGID